MTAVWKGPIPNTNYSAGRLNPVRFIVMHHMAATAVSADAHFHNPSSQVSAHYGVLREGSLWQWVANEDTAYHAGILTANYESVGIEHEDNGADDYTEAEYATSAGLVRDLCSRYGVPVARGHWPDRPGIVRHGEIVATACPGRLDVDRIIAQGGNMTPAEVQALIDASIAEYGQRLQAELDDPANGYEKKNAPIKSHGHTGTVSVT